MNPADLTSARAGREETQGIRNKMAEVSSVSARKSGLRCFRLKLRLINKKEPGELSSPGLFVTAFLASEGHELRVTNLGSVPGDDRSSRSREEVVVQADATRVHLDAWIEGIGDHESGSHAAGELIGRSARAVTQVDILVVRLKNCSASS